MQLFRLSQGALQEIQAVCQGTRLSLQKKNSRSVFGDATLPEAMRDKLDSVQVKKRLVEETDFGQRFQPAIGEFL